MAATPAPWGWLPHVVRQRARGTVWWMSGGVIEDCNNEALVHEVSGKGSVSNPHG